MDAHKEDRLAELFLAVWKDLTAQRQEGLSEGDGARLLRVEGGRAVLLHIAKLLGYEVSLKEEKDGREGTEPGPESGRSPTKAKRKTRKS